MDSELSPCLAVKNLTVHYGTVRAVEELSLEVGEGEIVALIGANGAGKTTVLRTIAGLVRPRAGEIWYQGSRLDGTSPHRIAGEGIRMVPEGRHIFPLMTVRDNLLMGAFLRRNRAEVRDDLAYVCGRFPRLVERLHQEAGTLSGGEQQMVAMGRALMARPKLLLLDEPSLGLAPMIVREIARVIKTVNQEDGVSVILVEQNSRLALHISRRACVLESGRVALAGMSADLRRDDTVRRVYLGATG